jgi:capsular exopolysaccharide synthesis family protein
MNNNEALAPIDQDLFKADPFDADAPATYGYEEPKKRVNLGKYWQAIRKRLWFIISLTIICTLVTVVYVAQFADYYRATARVQVNLEGFPLGASKNTPIMLNSYDPTYFSSQLQILEGTGLLRRVVKEYDLVHNKTFINPRKGKDRSVWQNVLRMFGLGKKNDEEMTSVASEQLKSANDSNIVAGGPNQESDEEEIEVLAPYVGLLRGGLNVSPVKETRVTNKETRLIDIRFTHPDPVVATKMANAIAETYVAMNLENKISTNANAGDFLQKRVAELQSEIRSSEERLINYGRSNQILSLDANQDTTVQRLTDLNAKLSEAEARRIEAEANYRASLLPGAASAKSETTDTRSPAIEARLSELRQRRQQLLIDFMEGAPEVKDIDGQIALAERELRETRNRSSKTLTTNLESTFKEAQERERELRKAFNAQRSEVLAQNGAAINYRIIQQEIATNKSLLDNLLERSKENDMVLTGTSNNVLVVDRALKPNSPVGPDRMKYVAVAFVASLGLGLALALFLNYLDDSVRSAEDVEESLRFPVLTEIPAIAGSKRTLLSSKKRRLKERREVYSSAPIFNLKASPTLFESYMQLRTSFLLATAGGPPQTLLVTSGQPSEGKTTTAINLGSVLAQTGASVLIIDADLRGAHIHDTLELETEAGLSNLLTSKDIDEHWVLETIKYHQGSGLHVLPGGSPPPMPANLLSSAQMRKLMAFLRQKFTYIIIDSPPTLMFTDSIVLSTLTDGVLLVVCNSKTTNEEMLRTKRMLMDVGAKLFGVAFNGTAERKSSYYDHRYYQVPKLKDVDNSSTLGLSAG